MIKYCIKIRLDIIKNAVQAQKLKLQHAEIVFGSITLTCLTNSCTVLHIKCKMLESSVQHNEDLVDCIKTAEKQHVVKYEAKL